MHNKAKKIKRLRSSQELKTRLKRERYRRRDHQIPRHQSKISKLIWKRLIMILESRPVSQCSVLIHHNSTTQPVRSQDIKARAMTRKADQETSTTHLAKWWDTSRSSHTMTTSMEIKGSSIHSSRSIKLNSASITSKVANVLLLNIASLPTDKKISDSQMTHYQRTSARLPWVLSTPTTRPFHASSGPKMVTASLVKDVLSTMTPKRRDVSSIHCPTFPKVLPCHQCLKNLKRHATIINIRIIIIATILQVTVTIPLISMEITHTNSSFHPTSTWATILASKTQWFK